MILIFSTPTCAYCKQVKQFLDRKQIKWEERDAFTDPEYPALLERYGMTVPLVYNTVTDKGTIGYDISRLLGVVA